MRSLCDVPNILCPQILIICKICIHFPWNLPLTKPRSSYFTKSFFQKIYHFRLTTFLKLLHCVGTLYLHKLYIFHTIQTFEKLLILEEFILYAMRTFYHNQEVAHLVVVEQTISKEQSARIVFNFTIVKNMQCEKRTHFSDP